METTKERGPEEGISGTSSTGQKQIDHDQQEVKKKLSRAMVAIDDSKESFYALTWTLDKLFSSTIQTAAPHDHHPNSTDLLGTSPAAERVRTPPPPPDDHLPLHVEESNHLVTLVHVMEPLPHYAYPGGYVVETATKAQEQNAAKILSRASQLCNEKKVAAEMVVIEGDPKEMICETAEKMCVDVLVVGSRGLGQIKRALLGSVSDYCAHHAKCPVAIVKLPKESHHHNHK